MRKGREQVQRQTKAQKHEPTAKKQHPDAPIPMQTQQVSPQMMLQLQRQIGNRAVLNLLRGQPVASPPQQSIQRIMDVDSFKEATTLFGEEAFNRTRNRITTVDTALDAYRQIIVDDILPDNDGIDNKRTRVDELIAACQDYLAERGAKRKKGVRKLLAQAQGEKQVIDLFYQSKNTADNAQKFQLLIQAQDAQLNLQTRGLLPQFRMVVDAGKWIDDVTRSLHADPAAMETVLQNEVDSLREIQANANTPPLLQQILAEVLANVDNVHLNASKPGARFTKDTEDFDEDYVVNHSLDARLGTADRLGSLTHELTHVSASETFSNTPLFLLFQEGASDEEIKGLSDTRTAYLEELEALALADTTLTESQKDLIKEKVQYPKKELKYYLGRFRSQLDDEIFTQLERLSEQGVTNTVNEFDTVINQMLMYAHIWQLPPRNRFYRRLTDVAQEAYDYRAAAREG